MILPLGVLKFFFSPLITIPKLLTLILCFIVYLMKFLLTMIAASTSAEISPEWPNPHWGIQPCTVCDCCTCSLWLGYLLVSWLIILQVIQPKLYLMIMNDDNWKNLIKTLGWNLNQYLVNIHLQISSLTPPSPILQFKHEPGLLCYSVLSWKHSLYIPAKVSITGNF